jgi:hypothetical protein
MHVVPQTAALGSCPRPDLVDLEVLELDRQHLLHDTMLASDSK